MSTPHEVLGIPTTATLDEARQAYRRLAMKAHPDKGGDAKTFDLIRQAYKKVMESAPCPTCGGKGFTTTRRGAFVDKTPCPQCWRAK